MSHLWCIFQIFRIINNILISNIKSTCAILISYKILHDDWDHIHYFFFSSLTNVISFWLWIFSPLRWPIEHLNIISNLMYFFCNVNVIYIPLLHNFHQCIYASIRLNELYHNLGMWYILCNVMNNFVPFFWMIEHFLILFFKICSLLSFPTLMYWLGVVKNRNILMESWVIRPVVSLVFFMWVNFNDK